MEDTWIDFLPRTFSLYLNCVFSPTSSKIYSLCVYVEGRSGGGGAVKAPTTFKGNWGGPEGIKMSKLTGNSH